MEAAVTTSALELREMELLLMLLQHSRKKMYHCSQCRLTGNGPCLRSLWLFARICVPRGAHRPPLVSVLRYRESSFPKTRDPNLFNNYFVATFTPPTIETGWKCQPVRMSMKTISEFDVAGFGRPALRRDGPGAAWQCMIISLSVTHYLLS